MPRSRPSVRLARMGLAALALIVAAGQGGAQPAPGYATQRATPRGFRLPEGRGCAADLARWRAIQDNDYASGNVGLPVYRQIQGEIARAEAACAAGRDAEARALVAASRRRHGYPG